jgi:rubredoxin
MQMICVNCGYIYNSEAGDPMSGVVPGTGFDSLPEGWVCPLCYAGKEAFDPLR